MTAVARTDQTAQDLVDIIARPILARRSLARRPAGRPRDPRRLEARYTRDLDRLNARLGREVLRVLGPALREIEREQDGQRQDQVGAGLEVALGTLRAVLTRLVQRTAPGLVDRQGRAINGFNTREIERVIRVSLGDQDGRAQQLLATWRSENLALIQSLPDRLLSDIQEILERAIPAGVPVRQLRTMLQQRINVSRSRAELIARDQTLKANSNLTQVRHEEAGIRQYRWSTSRDERVRSSHAALEGQVFSWSRPPVTNAAGDRNHPGEDFQCRCVAIPVIPGL